VLKNLKVKTVTGRILTSGDIHDHNTFDQPNKVTTKEFKQFKLKGDQLTVEMPARSVVSLELK
jgi:alpha-N-arabinofuranosidase